jgi:exonuclease SbcD
MFEKEKILLYIISGNHDKVNLIDEKSYLSVICNNREYVNLIEKEESIIGSNGIMLHFVPYFKEGSEYLGRLSNLLNHESFQNPMKHVLFTHTSINGVRNNDGSVVEGDVEQDFFNEFDLVLSGHYHQRSEVTDTIIYIGSAYQANFGEDEDKGFTILHNDLTLEYIQSKFPIYKKIIIDIEDEEKASNMLKEYADTDDNIRFVFKGSQQQIEQIDANKFTTSGISVQFENIVDRGVLFEEVEEAQIMSFDKKTVLKNYIMYSKQQEFNKDQLKQGMNLLNNIQF